MGRDDIIVDPGGILTAIPDKPCPIYNVNELFAYCRERGITTEQLTDDDLDKLTRGYMPPLC